MKIIVAMGQNREIGVNGRLPWHLSSDFKWFKAATVETSTIMGRKTYESIGRPLPNRQNIVVSSAMSKIDGIEIVPSLEEAIKIATSDLWVIGGAQLYQEAMKFPNCLRMHVTRIHHSFPEADVFFPEISSDMWELCGDPEQVQDLFSYQRELWVRKLEFWPK